MTPARVAPPHALEPAPEERAFRFSTGDAARSLEEFVTIVPRLPRETVDYHRGHYHYWLHDVVGDTKLARRVEKTALSGMDAEELRRTIVQMGTDRLAELRTGKSKSKSPPKKRAANGKKSTTTRKPAVKRKGRKL